MSDAVRRRLTQLVAVGLVGATGFVAAEPAISADLPLVPGGGVLRVSVPEAFGGKTVVGQLTVDRAAAPGFVTAYGCDGGLPRDADGEIDKSDLNYDGAVSPVASNRLIVEADDDGDVCFYTLRPVAMIVDVNGVSFDSGITSFANRRTDTRTRTKPLVRGGGVVRVSVPEAVGGKTVVGQLTVDRAAAPGFVTAYGCDGGLPRDADGEIDKSDLNYDGAVSPVASNRLIVEADDDGDVCFYTLRPVAMIVDVNGVSFDSGITSFANRRTDTRTRTKPLVRGGGVVRVSVPEAVGGKTVVGQLTVDRAAAPGFVTVYGCDGGLPRDADGEIDKSDLNYDGAVSPVASNRLIVEADDDGDVCFYTLRPVAIIVDVNGVSLGAGITSFPNRRTDTRSPNQPVGPTITPGGTGVPVWPPYTPTPSLVGVAALTGEPASGSVARRPILAVKIDNYRLARPQWGLEEADAIIEENVEGITRLVGLFQTRLPPRLGPVRSARTGDLDLLTAMNRPVFGYSGANQGVTAWVESAADSGILVDFSAQNRPCYTRDPSRPGPHNLSLDPRCAIDAARSAGPAGPLWNIDPAWTVPVGAAAVPDTTFDVAMDGVRVDWTWDPGSGRYWRSQDGAPHVAASGTQISARNVIELFTRHIPSPVDARSPNPITVGTGDAIIHRNGRAISGTWVRATAYNGFSFVESATGASIPLDRGTTFIELARDR